MPQSPDAASPDPAATETPTPVTTEAAAPETATASPDATTDRMSPGFGWVPYAERINGRFAMVGFVALLLLGLITRQDFFTWLGLR